MIERYAARVAEHPHDLPHDLRTTSMTRAEHWRTVHTTRPHDQVSWWQPTPTHSVELIERAAEPILRERPGEPVRVLDVGAGASTLVDHLVERGAFDVAALDISEDALDTARRRLGDRAAHVRWIIADAAQPLTEPEAHWADIWHDRAALHFLTDDEDLGLYMRNVARTLRPAGAAIFSQFAPEGPEQCSGLPVRRAGAQDLRRALERVGLTVSLEHESREDHVTPWGSTQTFLTTVFRRR